jgi:hypothetical protein
VNPGRAATMSGRCGMIRRMSRGALFRPASLAMAAAASASLLAGMLVPGLVLGAAAVAMAWVRPSVAPSDSSAKEGPETNAGG